MKLAIAILFLMLSSYAAACTVPPRTLLQSDRELVARSNNIALARVIGRETSDESYSDKFSFETLETIRGKPPANFELQGYWPQKENMNSGNFSNHTMPEFWAFAAGNTILPGDCSAYGLFEVGKTYLVFLDKPTHVRSFEQIDSEDDLWLKVVKLLVAEELR